MGRSVARASFGEEPPETEWAEARARLASDGWLYLPDFQPHDDGGERMLQFARSLGPLFRIRGTDPARPVVETLASRDAPYGEPFNQLPALGWHNDFSTRRFRPRWSLSYVCTEDIAGGGNWRVADSHAILSRLRGRSDLDVLNQLRERIPFSFLGDGAPTWHRALNSRGLRFYGRAMRDGARLAWGLSEQVEALIGAVESAADAEGHALRAASGTLLVVDNWRVLHDRTEQFCERRRTAIAFVVG